MKISLTAARVNRRLTRKEAAKALGIHEATLKNYEQGKTYPNVNMIKKMEALYGVDCNDINFLPENYP